jgi:hypothetical protein
MLDIVYVICDLYVMGFHSNAVSSSVVVVILRDMLLHKELSLLGSDAA